MTLLVAVRFRWWQGVYGTMDQVLAVIKLNEVGVVNAKSSILLTKLQAKLPYYKTLHYWSFEYRSWCGLCVVFTSHQDEDELDHQGYERTVVIPVSRHDFVRWAAQNPRSAFEVHNSTCLLMEDTIHYPRHLQPPRERRARPPPNEQCNVTFGIRGVPDAGTLELFNGAGVVEVIARCDASNLIGMNKRLQTQVLKLL